MRSGLVIAKINIKHCHETNANLFKLYRNSKKLEESEKTEILKLLELINVGVIEGDMIHAFHGFHLPRLAQ
jgi:hypothetical protein